MVEHAEDRVNARVGDGYATGAAGCPLGRTRFGTGGCASPCGRSRVYRQVARFPARG
jgi:hypothetical protein